MQRSQYKGIFLTNEGVGVRKLKREKYVDRMDIATIARNEKVERGARETNETTEN